MMKRARVLSTLSITATVGVLLTGCGAATNTSSANHNQTANQTTGASNQSSSSTANSSKTVTIAWLGWTEDIAISNMWKDILESKGYKVDMKELGAGPIFIGLSQNKANLFLDAWLPTDNTFVKKYQSSLQSLGVWYTGVSSGGVAVPKYMKNINTPQQLNQHASEFKNTIVGIEPGSEENKLVKKMIKVYGMNKMHLKTSSTPAMLAAIKRAYSHKQPIATVMWTPLWAFTKYHLKYLSDPKKILAGNSHLTIEANKTWVKNNPKIAGWFKNFKLTPNQLGKLEEDVKNTKNKAAGANKWIKNNQSLVNSWIQ